MDISQIAATAIFESLKQEARDKLIKDALAHLMTDNKDGYGYAKSGSSPLQNAFNEALRVEARKAVQDAVAKDPAIQDAVAKLVSQATTKILSDENMAAAIANQVVERMTSALWK